MNLLISFIFLGFFGFVLSLKCYKCRDEDGPVYIQNSKCANNSNSHVFDCDKQCILEGLVFHYSVDANDELTYHRVYVHRGCGSFFTKDFCNFHKNKTKEILYQKVFVQKYECDTDLCNGDKFVYNLEELKKSEVLCEKTASNDSGLNLKRNQFGSVIRNKRNDRAKRPTPKPWKQARQDDMAAMMMPMMMPDAMMTMAASMPASMPAPDAPGGKPQDDMGGMMPGGMGTTGKPGGSTGAGENGTTAAGSAPISIKIHPMVFIPPILTIFLQSNFF